MVLHLSSKEKAILCPKLSLFVLTTESADYCYLQKHAPTKQVFQIVGFFVEKKSSLYLIAKSLKLQDPKE